MLQLSSFFLSPASLPSSCHIHISSSSQLHSPCRLAESLRPSDFRPRLWKRYVDDTFCILRKGSTEELLRHLNRVRPTIKFTVEQEEDRALPFLDTLLRRRENGSLDVSIYRKPMHTDHLESHYLTDVKRGVVRCLHERTRGIISTQDNL